MKPQDALDALQTASQVPLDRPSIVRYLCRRHRVVKKGGEYRLNPRNHHLKDRELTPERMQRMKGFLRKAVDRCSKREESYNSGSLSAAVNLLNLDEDDWEEFTGRLNPELHESSLAALDDDALLHIQSFLNPREEKSLGQVDERQQGLHVREDVFTNPSLVLQHSRAAADKQEAGDFQDDLDYANDRLAEAIEEHAKSPGSKDSQDRVNRRMKALAKAWEKNLPSTIDSADTLWVATMAMLFTGRVAESLELIIDPRIKPERYYPLAKGLGELRGGLSRLTLVMPDTSSVASLRSKEEGHKTMAYENGLTMVLKSLTQYHKLEFLCIRHGVAALGFRLSALNSANAELLVKAIERNRNLNTLLIGRMGGETSEANLMKVVEAYKKWHPDGLLQIPGEWPQPASSFVEKDPRIEKAAKSDLSGRRW